jgi:hypothetical protein
LEYPSDEPSVSDSALVQNHITHEETYTANNINIKILLFAILGILVLFGVSGGLAYYRLKEKKNNEN